MEKTIIILVAIGLLYLFIWSARSIHKNKVKTEKIYLKYKPLVENVNSVHKVKELLSELEELVFDKHSDKRWFYKIDIAYKSEFTRLFTILEVKYNFLKNKENE